MARWECSLQGPHDDQDWRLHSLLSPPGGAEYRQVLHLGQRIGLSYEGFDGLNVEHGLVDVAEEGLLANVLDPTSSLLKIVPGNQTT